MVEGQMICARKQLVWVVGSGPHHYLVLLASTGLEIQRSTIPSHSSITAGMSGCSNYSLFREEKWSGEMVRWVP